MPSSRKRYDRLKNPYYKARGGRPSAPFQRLAQVQTGPTLPNLPKASEAVSTDTLTFAGAFQFHEGDVIVMRVPDRRWWRRVLHFVLLLDQPFRKVKHTVRSVGHDTLTLSTQDATHPRQGR